METVNGDSVKMSETTGTNAYVNYLAKKTDTQITTATYAIADATSSCYSTFKNICDYTHANSSIAASNALHDLLISPEGMAAAIIGSMGLICFSVAGNLFSDKDKNAIKRYSAQSWPYIRDSLKSVKNSFKGIKSALAVTSTITALDLRFILVPSALALGGISILNRLWYRRMVEKRKNMMSQNSALLEALFGITIHYNLESFPEGEELEEYKSSFIIQDNQLIYITQDLETKIITPKKNDNFTQELLAQLPPTEKSLTIAKDEFHNALIKNGADIPESFTQEYLDKIRNIINEQQQWAHKNKLLNFTSQAFAGFIDGLYLYMGVIIVSSVFPPLFIALAAASLAFTLLCIVSRVYEEYDFQKKLKISQAKVELATLSKELNLLFNKIYTNNPLIAQCDSLIEEFREKACAFQEKRDYLHKNRYTPSLGIAILEGIKNGMTAYSAITCLMFMAVTICLFASVAFPPAAIIATVIVGVFAMLGLIGYSLYQYYSKENETIIEMHNNLETVLTTKQPIQNIDPQIIKTAINKDLEYKESKSSSLTNWFHVFRGGFSGLKKAENVTANFALAGLQDINDNGRYCSSPAITIISAITGVIFSIIFACREFAKRFGRQSLDSTNIVSLNMPAPKAENIQSPIAQPITVTAQTPERTPIIPIDIEDYSDQIDDDNLCDSPRSPAEFDRYDRQFASPHISEESTSPTIICSQRHEIIKEEHKEPSVNIGALHSNRRRKSDLSINTSRTLLAPIRENSVTDDFTPSSNHAPFASKHASLYKNPELTIIDPKIYDKNSVTTQDKRNPEKLRRRNTFYCSPRRPNSFEFSPSLNEALNQKSTSSSGSDIAKHIEPGSPISSANISSPRSNIPTKNLSTFSVFNFPPNRSLTTSHTSSDSIDEAENVPVYIETFQSQQETTHHSPFTIPITP